MPPLKWEIGRIYQDTDHSIVLVTAMDDRHFSGTYVTHDLNIGYSGTFTKGTHWTEINAEQFNIALKAILKDRTKRVLSSKSLDSTGMMVIDNSVFTLFEEPHSDLSGFLARREALQGVLIEGITRNFTHELQRIVSHTPPKPIEIPFNIMERYQFRIFTYSGGIGYSLPIKFAPRFVALGKSRRTISAEHQEQIARPNARLLALTIRSNEVFFALQDSKTLAWIEHYHGQSPPMCTGEYHPDVPQSYEDLIRCRDHIQAELEVVNASSPIQHHPLHMPTIEDVWEDGTGDSDEFISGGLLKLPTPEPEGNKIEVGSLVQVTRRYDSFPQHSVGSVGQVILTGIGEGVGVEFLFTLPMFHDCGGVGSGRHCYNFSQDCVRLVYGRGRTRELGIWDRITVEEQREISQQVTRRI